jgi:hypothetical protein
MEGAVQTAVLILTCLAATPQEACTRQTAVDVRELLVDNSMQCANAGLFTAASDPLGSAGLFTKIICARPTTREGQNGGE